MWPLKVLTEEIEFKREIKHIKEEIEFYKALEKTERENLNRLKSSLRSAIDQGPTGGEIVIKVMNKQLTKKDLSTNADFQSTLLSTIQDIAKSRQQSEQTQSKRPNLVPRLSIKAVEKHRKALPHVADLSPAGPVPPPPKSIDRKLSTPVADRYAIASV